MQFRTNGHYLPSRRAYLYTKSKKALKMEKLKQIIEAVRRWVGEDGLKHFFVSFLLLVAFGWIRPFWGALLVVLAIGIGKEIFDLCKKGPRAWRDSLHDLACDVAGLALAALFIFLNSLAS